jgi:pimeloyl-ACP methyl ester carboxylesterase
VRIEIKRCLSAMLLAAAMLLPAGAVAQTATPGPCITGKLPSGALSLICVPTSGWNRELVVFAHGYVAPGLPLSFPNLTLGDGTSVPGLVQSLGYAFATTSYRQNGLAILEGVGDIRELVAAFRTPNRVPVRTHVAGVSEGGLVATLLAERSPDLVDSAVAACGPIGSFKGQVESFGDFRVLFDYFFPGVIPGSPIEIPGQVIEKWSTVYIPRILGALAANQAKARELMRVSRAAHDPANPATIGLTTINMLFYNVIGTNDAVAKLGGNPFGNRLKWYFGSSNDLRLNLSVRRFTASPAARSAMRNYETTGDLRIPLVTLHTTGDEVIPIWHQLLYLPKLDLSGRGRFIPLPVFRYGHCNFTSAELLTAFGLAVR